MRPSSLSAIVVLLTIALSDAALKIYALGHFPSETAAPIAWPVALAVHRNPGIAFDIPIPLSIVLPITILICGVFARLAFTHSHNNPKQSLAALAAVLGALGNGIDRLINGFTTDYLIFFRTSAINLSDVLILLGIFGVLWYDKRIPNPDVSG